MLRKLLTIMAVAISLTNVGTTRASDEDPLLIDYDQFHSLPYAERRALIVRLTPPAQLTAYLDMLEESEPPDLELASIIAPSGRALVHAIRDRLESGDSDLRILDMAALLLAIDRGGHATVRAEGSVLEVLESRIRGLRNEDRREMALGMLAKMR